MSKQAFVRVGKTPGIYKRSSRFYAGYMLNGKWTLTALDADT